MKVTHMLLKLKCSFSCDYGTVMYFRVVLAISADRVVVYFVQTFDCLLMKALCKIQTVTLKYIII